MIRAAVIGGIGSGKTFVANLFKCPVFNADDEVKIIYKKNKACFNKFIVSSSIYGSIFCQILKAFWA